MSTGLWITIGIILFILGSIMSLKPSAKEKALGLMRERGRILGLHPRLVPCPDWLINTHGQKGKGMVALYGVVIPEAKLPASNALVIDGVIEVVDGDVSLADDRCGIKDALGVTMQANYIGVYIKETLDFGNGNLKNMTPEKVDVHLKKLKEHLQLWAEKVQA